MYLIYTISFGSAIVCGPLAACCACALACTGVPMLACFILTGLRILGNVGTACRESALTYNAVGEDELSFAADGDLVRKLWIA